VLARSLSPFGLAANWLRRASSLPIFFYIVIYTAG